MYIPSLRFAKSAKNSIKAMIGVLGFLLYCGIGKTLIEVK